MSIVLAPTATKIPPEAAGAVLVTGSHGGAYVGWLAARAGVRALVASDAGVGRDRAGIASLALGDDVGMAAVAIDCRSARIGDAEDLLRRGRVSHANRLARELGVEAGMPCARAAELLAGAPLPERMPPVHAEARHEVGWNRHGLRLVCVDSVSLVRPEDAGQVVLSGSHGGLVAGQHHLAIRVAAAAAFYNDAGIGADEAGVSRLPVLAERGIPAATVSADSARIGDGRSTWADGLLSRVNAPAAALGMAPGMPAREAAERVVPAPDEPVPPAD